MSKQLCFKAPEPMENQFYFSLSLLFMVRKIYAPLHCKDYAGIVLRCPNYTENLSTYLLISVTMESKTMRCLKISHPETRLQRKRNLVNLFSSRMLQDKSTL